MKTAQLKAINQDVRAVAIAMQSASVDIWDKKYRLKAKDGQIVDETIDDTYQRVAQALADVEETAEKQEFWYNKFLHALQQGAIPAGRIISNAGALQYKPATSTINCTVSGTIRDSMDDILQKVHEAGLTLKAGCVAPGTWVYTDQGLVTADRAVAEQHERILCYDRDRKRFELRAIEQHLKTHVPRTENIEITANSVSLKTSIKHPVLVYRSGRLHYVRADEVTTSDALVQHRFAWTADTAAALSAWFVGAHLGDGSAYEKTMHYKPSRQAWAARARSYSKRLVFKIRAAEREVVERYAEFFTHFCAAQAKVMATVTANGTPVWDYTVASFAASQAADLIDHQIGKKSANLRVPEWIVQQPEKYFLPFLAGLIDTDGTVSKERGSAIIAMSSYDFAEQLQALLGLFGVNVGITQRQPRSHVYRGHRINDCGGCMLKISDSAFLQCVAAYMADSGKRRRITDYASQAGQYDRYVMPQCLAAALAERFEQLNHNERLKLGFYHRYHEKTIVSRIFLERWARRFPALKSLIDFAMTLRPVEAIRRNLDLSETFFDFTVEGHNNYLAGNAGLVVIHNCGIGYDYSTLRPRGAYVSGAGAYTSGPLSFMDIYDKMCFTVSSAGGRRGAQMATFDVGHPDVLEFIKAKREDGRLRQFNLSLLITDEFMQAVKDDSSWPLAFPLLATEADDSVDLNDPEQVIWRDWPIKDELVVNEQGQAACKIYKTIPARRLWDVIMSSTYDYAEPGFILIDQYNTMNNNWFCEDIRATNPCVTADTWVHTEQGPRQVRDLIGQRFKARVDGQDHSTGPEGFFKTATKPVVQLKTVEGHSLRLTADHRVRRVTHYSRHKTVTEWCAVSELQSGDRVLLNDHRNQSHWQGTHTFGEGYLLGLLLGDGVVKENEAVLSVWDTAATAQVANSDIQTNQAEKTGPQAIMAAAANYAFQLPHRSDFRGWMKVSGRNEYRLSMARLTALATDLGLRPGYKAITPRMEQTSSDFHRGLLRGFFDADGSVQGSQQKGVSVRLAQSDLERLQAVQRMLLRLGVVARIYQNRRPAGQQRLPDGKGEYANYAIKSQHELVISGANLAKFADQIGFSDSDKQTKLEYYLANYQRQLNRERFTAVVKELTADGVEDVYDVQVPGINTFDGNGFHAHNCGEQGLPPYGSCLLGSINLTKFVCDPFTDHARFDWDAYRDVVATFTRMLDNVVEINGLPLEKQREEITRKRRHGMGYLGLGSTLTMLRVKYGSPEAVKFTEEVTREMALIGLGNGVGVGERKRPCTDYGRRLHCQRRNAGQAAGNAC